MPFFGGIGAPEMLIFGTIALLLFGKRLPEVARSLGQGIGQFKKGMTGLQDEFRKAAEPDPTPSPRRVTAPAADAEADAVAAPAFAPPPEEPIPVTAGEPAAVPEPREPAGTAL